MNYRLGVMAALLLATQAVAAEAPKKPAPPTVEALQAQIKDLTAQNAQAQAALANAQTLIKALQLQRNSVADADVQMLASQASETQRYADQLNARQAGRP